MSEPRGARVQRCLQTNMLTILTVAGVLGGMIVGGILRGLQSSPWTARDVMYLQFPGDIFLRMLKALIVPLLTSSIISAIGNLDLSMSKKIAMRSIGYYACTTACAVTLGIVLVCTIRPGSGASDLQTQETKKVVRDVLTIDTLMDLIRNLFPPNLIQATIGQFRTILEPAPFNVSIPLEQRLIKTEYDNTTNILGLVGFSIAFGVSIGILGNRGKPLLTFFDTLSEAMMIITNWVIWVSPLGVFFLVAVKMLEIQDLTDVVQKLGLYFVTVLLGLFIHGFGTLSVIYFVMTRTLPFRTIGKLGQVLATAFGTASSSATMPLTIQAMDKMGVDPRITRFVIPIGATINMDGTALYEAVAAIFISQIRNIEMSFGKLVAVSITATAASIGAAGIPQAGLITMVMVLDTVGLPSEDISLILAVDWLLDRFRTTINVMCDALGAKLVDMLSQDDLHKKGPCDPLEMDRLNADPQEVVEIVPKKGGGDNSHDDV